MWFVSNFALGLRLQSEALMQELQYFRHSRIVQIRGHECIHAETKTFSSLPL